MSLHDDFRLWKQTLTHIFMDVVDPNPFRPIEEIDTPRGLLKFWDAFGSQLVEVGFFLSIAWTIWRRYSCPPNAPYKAFLACSFSSLLPCGLVLIIGCVYHLSRRSAKVELSIAEKLFPQGHLPESWTGRRAALGISVSVIGFFLLYIGLAWTSNNIRLVSLFMLLIACIDFNTSRLINIRINEYFSDARYAPNREDDDYSLIQARRDIIREYLYKKPHLWKEAARVFGCATAFGIATIGPLYGIARARSAAYLFLGATLITNEVVMWRWRAQRTRSLLTLERRLSDRPTIPFSRIAWLFSILYVILCAFVSLKEGTFTSSPAVTMGFVNHGGMWGDLIILPIVNGLLVPHLSRITTKRILVAFALLAVAVAVTIIAHQQWAAMGRMLGTTDDIFPSHSTGRWYRDLSVAGYLHVIYMSTELTLILAYVVMRIPALTVLLVSLLLALHVTIGQVQPALYSTGTLWTTRTIIPTLTTVMLTSLVAIYKMRQANRYAS